MKTKAETVLPEYIGFETKTFGPRSESTEPKNEAIEPKPHDRRRPGRKDVNKNLLHLLRTSPEVVNPPKDETTAGYDATPNWLMPSPAQVNHELILIRMLRLTALFCVLFVAVLLFS